MMLGLKELIVSVSHFENWCSDLLKSFKLDDLEQLENRFKILADEGLDFCALTESNSHYYLESFPEATQFCRLKMKGPGEEDIPSLQDKIDQGIPELMLKWDQGSLDHLPDSSEVIVNLAHIQQAGGNAVLELAGMFSFLEVLEKKNYQVINFIFALDSRQFYQISKLRAARVILDALKDQGYKSKFQIIATPSIAEFSFFEKTSLMLRNTASISAAMMGGADWIALDNAIDPEDETFWRQTRNAFHVLAEESNLSRTKDPAAGSYLVESLTDYLVKESHNWFLENQKKGLDSQLDFLSQACEKLFSLKRDLVETRKTIIVGVNNYSDPSEFTTLKESWETPAKFPVRRAVARIEKLREALQTKTMSPILYSFGELNQVFDRVNFAKNFFEVTGKEVHHVHKKQFDFEAGDESFIILCARDDDYPEIIEKMKDHGKPIFIVSREVKIRPCHNLYQGLNLVDFFNDTLPEVKELL